MSFFVSFWGGETPSSSDQLEGKKIKSDLSIYDVR